MSAAISGPPGPAPAVGTCRVCSPCSQARADEGVQFWGRSVLAWALLSQLLSRCAWWGAGHAGGSGGGWQAAVTLTPASALTPQLFDIRPIWSRNAVKANISVHPDKLKVLLPFVAYYMVSVYPAAHPGSHLVPVPDAASQSRGAPRRPATAVRGTPPPPRLLRNAFGHAGMILESEQLHDVEGVKGALHSPMTQ